MRDTWEHSDYLLAMDGDDDDENYNDDDEDEKYNLYWAYFCHLSNIF